MAKKNMEVSDTTSEGTTSSTSRGHAVSKTAAHTASAVAETTASPEAKRRPTQSFKEGEVSASVWSREVLIEGKPVIFRSLSCERAYRDRDGTTRYTKNFDANDLGALLTVIQRAAQYIQGLEQLPVKEPMPDQAD